MDVVDPRVDHGDLHALAPDPGVVDGLGADVDDAPGVVVLVLAGRCGLDDRLERRDRRVELDRRDVRVPAQAGYGVRRHLDGHAVDERVRVADGTAEGPDGPALGGAGLAVEQDDGPDRRAAGAFGRDGHRARRPRERGDERPDRQRDTNARPGPAPPRHPAHRDASFSQCVASHGRRTRSREQEGFRRRCPWRCRSTPRLPGCRLAIARDGRDTPRRGCPRGPVCEERRRQHRLPATASVTTAPASVPIA